MPLEQWDPEVAHHLNEIEFGANRIRTYTALVLTSCHSLAKRPAWQSRAEDEIDKAIAVLERALSGLKEAREIYRKKELDG